MDQILSKIFSLWFEEISLNYSPHTICAYQKDVLHFFNFLSTHLGKECEQNDLILLKNQDIRSWLAKRQETFSLRSTVRAFSAVKMFFLYLKKHNVIESSPFDTMRPPKLAKLLPKPLSCEQAFDIINNVGSMAQKSWVGNRNEAFFALLYSVGLRISEALNLNQSILQNDHFVVLGKGKKQRVVPLLIEVKEKLLTYLSLCPFEQKKDSPLFYGEQGKRLNVSVAQKVLRDYKTLSYLPSYTTPHAFRHSCATHIIDQTNDLRTVQELLGHASLSTTQIYTKISQEKLLKSYNDAHPKAKSTAKRK
jgi:integrase/recombinase XerC